MKKFLKIAKVNSEKEFYDKYPTEESFFSEFPDIGKQYGFGGNIKRMKYGFGSWLGENAGNIIKTGAGAALTATGVAAPIGIGLMASGATDMAANTLTEDPNAQAALRATGQVAGIAGGAMMGKVGYAMGGNTQLSEINNGGTHEQNPMGGVPMGQAASVEQGETKWEDYIFSDRIKIPGAKHTFADESKKIQKKYPKERENDVPTQKAKKKEMERLMATQEAIRTEMGVNNDIQMANGGSLKTSNNPPKDNETDLTAEELKWLATIKRGTESAEYVTPSYRKTKGYGTDFGRLTDSQLGQLKNYMTNTDIITDIIEGITPNTEFFNPKPKNSKLAYGGRMKFPDGGTISTGTDSLGRTVYPSDKVSDKAKKYFEENPSLFNTIGPPKQETTIDTNKDAIIKSLNNSKTVSGTPSSIPMDNLKWIKEPSIEGWQQAYDPIKKKTAYRPVTTGSNGRPIYGPIEYALGGRIKMNNGGIDPNSFLALNQTLNPNLGNLGQASIPMPNVPIEEEYVAPTIYDTTPVETVRRTFSSDPTSNNNLARTDFSGTEHPSFMEPVTQIAKTTSPPNTTNTTTPNNVPDSGLETPKQKGSSGFDKYDAITMGAQLLPAMYNIGQGLRKQKPVDLGRMTPNLVNYDSSRKASEDSFNQQANILNEGIRENATSSGQALSNRVAFANRAALDKANQLGQINEREFNTNQQIRGNADQVNLQIRANEEQIDAQNKGISQTAVGMGLAQVGQAAGTINRDRNLRNTERETIGMMGQGSDFGIEYDEDGNPVIRFKNRKNTTPTTGKK